MVFLGDIHLLKTIADIFIYGFLEKLVFRILEDKTDILSYLHRVLLVAACKVAVFCMDNDVTLSGSEYRIHMRYQCGLAASALAYDT